VSDSFFKVWVLGFEFDSPIADRTLDNTVAQHTDLPGEFSVGYLGAQSSCLVDAANLGAKKASQFALAHVYRPCPSNLTYPFSSKKKSNILLEYV
jgi:hypothetical protein